jgi:hypothetical protein
MIELEQQRGGDARYSFRRSYERYDLNASGGSLKYRGTTFLCDVIDISIGGCCLRTKTRFTAGNLAPIEVTVPIFGMFLHMIGITQWVSGECLIGVRFIHPSAQSKNQLAGLLTCLVDQSAVEVVTEAVVAAATDPRAPKILDLEIPQSIIQSHKRSFESPQSRTDSEKQSSSSISPSTSSEPPAPSIEPPFESGIRIGESKLLSSKNDDWSAVLDLLKNGSQVAGTITGFNLDGCIFRISSRFGGAIRMRVEVEFHTRGLFLRMPGIIEEILDKQFVAIRFLEMSRRRREDLELLLEELQEENDK